MPLLVQHILVTLAAIAAASIVVRRVFTTVRPGAEAAPRCASCPVAQLKQGTEFADSQIVRVGD
jgi:hypothetical protein